MHIADQTKLIIGVVFAVLGVAILVSSRRTRGFGQRKQAGALMVVAGLLFIAKGLGLVDFHGLMGR
jgi:hypothetical protein